MSAILFRRDRAGLSHEVRDGGLEFVTGLGIGLIFSQAD